MPGLKKICAFASVAIMGSGANASLIVYDSFNYTSGANLLGQNGGTGFNGAYIQTDTFNPNSDHTISSSTLTYSNLVTSGLAVTAPAAGAPDFFATTARAFTLPGGTNFGTTNGTLYASFLIRPGTAVGGSFGGIALTNNDSGSSNKPVFIGDSSGFYGIEEQGGGGASQSTGIASTANQTRLLVVKYTFATGNDTVQLYVDPVVGQAEPAVANASISLPTDFLRMELLDGSRSYQYDEFRLGNTFADVTPLVATNKISLLNFAGGIGTNVAEGSAVHVTGSGNSYVSEVDGLTSNSNSAFVQVDQNLSQNAPVYVMLWTENDAVLAGGLAATNGALVTPGTDQWNALQAAYGASGIAGEDFNYLVKFTTNSFGTFHGSVNWDFGLDTSVKIDRIAVVPEPATMSMLGLAGLPLLGRRRRT
jgi:hypothetical protein